jgi:hypothetical protein
MKKPITLLGLFLLVIQLNAQKSDDVTALFREEKPLDVKLKVSIKDIKKKTNDSTYLPAVFYSKNKEGQWDSINIEIRSRGMFRLKTCYFPPLRIKIDKENSKGTALKGNKSLKLVMPCLNNDKKNTLVLKEYICYQMLEEVTPYYFNTRLINLEFIEVDGKKIKNHILTAFLIEDDDMVAKRHHATVIENLKLHPLGLNDTSSIRHDFFQLMIANTDWSTTFSHNAKVIYQEPAKKYIPLAYDFDMSGFVDAPYAIVNSELGIASVRDRLYRGFCRKEPVVQFVRKEFLAAEPKIFDVLGQYEKDFTPKEFTAMKSYLAEFFTMLKKDSEFKNMVLDGCRTK